MLMWSGVQLQTSPRFGEPDSSEDAHHPHSSGPSVHETRGLFQSQPSSHPPPRLPQKTGGELAKLHLRTASHSAHSSAHLHAIAATFEFNNGRPFCQIHGVSTPMAANLGLKVLQWFAGISFDFMNLAPLVSQWRDRTFALSYNVQNPFRLGRPCRHWKGRSKGRRVQRDRGHG